MRKIGWIYTKCEDWITNLLMIGVIIFVFTAALLRWIGHPISWSVEIAQLMFIWVIFLGANKALRQNKHIGVDFLIKRLPKHVRIIVELLMNLLILVFLVYIGFYGFQLSLDNASRQINNLSMSYSFVTLAVPLGCLLMSITLLNKVVTQWNTLRNSDAGEAEEG